MVGSTDLASRFATYTQIDSPEGSAGPATEPGVYDCALLMRGNDKGSKTDIGVRAIFGGGWIDFARKIWGSARKNELQN